MSGFGDWMGELAAAGANNQITRKRGADARSAMTEQQTLRDVTMMPEDLIQKQQANAMGALGLGQATREDPLHARGVKSLMGRSDQDMAYMMMGQTPPPSPPVAGENVMAPRAVTNVAGIPGQAPRPGSPSIAQQVAQQISSASPTTANSISPFTNKPYIENLPTTRMAMPPTGSGGARAGAPNSNFTTQPLTLNTPPTSTYPERPFNASVGLAQVMDETPRGSQTRDTVDFKLARNEAVLNAGAAANLGRENIQALNKQGLRDMGLPENIQPKLKDGKIHANVGFAPHLMAEMEELTTNPKYYVDEQAAANGSQSARAAEVLKQADQLAARGAPVDPLRARMNEGLPKNTAYQRGFGAAKGAIDYLDNPELYKKIAAGASKAASYLPEVAAGADVLLDRKPGEFYDDPNIPFLDRAGQAGRDILHKGLPATLASAAGIVGAPVGTAIAGPAGGIALGGVLGAAGYGGGRMIAREIADEEGTAYKNWKKYNQAIVNPEAAAAAAAPKEVPQVGATLQDLKDSDKMGREYMEAQAKKAGTAQHNAIMSQGGLRAALTMMDIGKIGGNAGARAGVENMQKRDMERSKLKFDMMMKQNDIDEKNMDRFGKSFRMDDKGNQVEDKSKDSQTASMAAAFRATHGRGPTPMEIAELKSQADLAGNIAALDPEHFSSNGPVRFDKNGTKRQAGFWEAMNPRNKGVKVLDDYVMGNNVYDIQGTNGSRPFSTRAGSGGNIDAMTAMEAAYRNAKGR